MKMTPNDRFFMFHSLCFTFRRSLPTFVRTKKSGFWAFFLWIRGGKRGYL
jgi:hypothetical protein